MLLVLLERKREVGGLSTIIIPVAIQSPLPALKLLRERKANLLLPEILQKDLTSDILFAALPEQSLPTRLHVA